MFKIYKAKVVNPVNKKIKAIRSNRGAKYYGRYNGSARCLGPFTNFLKECGVIVGYIMPGISRQNGVTERQNRILKNMVRSMIAHTTLPESLCTEALKMTTYFLNRVPSKIVTKISYEL